MTCLYQKLRYCYLALCALDLHDMLSKNGCQGGAS